MSSSASSPSRMLSSSAPIALITPKLSFLVPSTGDMRVLLTLSGIRAASAIQAGLFQQSPLLKADGKSRVATFLTCLSSSFSIAPRDLATKVAKVALFRKRSSMLQITA